MFFFKSPVCSFLLIVFIGTQLFLSACSGKGSDQKTNAVDYGSDLLKPAGKEFLDSMAKAFSCSPIQYSKINRSIDGKEIHLFAIKVKACSGNLSFDSVYRYIDMPELISTRVYGALVSPKQFDQVQFSCESSDNRQSVFSIFSVSDGKLEYVQSFVETTH